MESDTDSNKKDQLSESDSLYIFCIASQTFSSEEKEKVLNQINSC